MVWTKESAEKARNEADLLRALLSSDIGTKIVDKLNSIESQATRKSMLGDTPLNTNGYFEARGQFQAVTQIRKMIDDVFDDESKAITWLTENAPASENEQ